MTGVRDAARARDKDRGEREREREKCFGQRLHAHVSM